MNHPDQPIRVMIADDHPMMRDGIAATLRAQGGMDIVSLASNGAEAIAQFARHRPDVTLMDLQMPVKDGLEAIVAIRALHPDARIIVLTTFSGDARVIAALKAGATGYLLKDVTAAELAHTVRHVYQGASVIAKVAQDEVDGHFPADKLSARELEVLRLAANGNSNRMIGAILTISEPTVKSHMSTVLVKLGASDRTHAVTLAIKRGYITL
ncbi:response regulator transcription factor [Oxalobacteraceae sp. CFBP 13708]|jgi:DNA-binding NarL/FixJ family response regulator|nr:response regulator transcription factor [Oxalobacteraceae sp. CFBP 8761]MBD8627225.1 response regulator transcription factor [Oxalobacteraceae sp. CFBP 8753]MBD8723897.1 response regulator transcription factor [Oxalobacteraceae sp. CFBP 13708]